MLNIHCRRSHFSGIALLRYCSLLVAISIPTARCLRAAERAEAGSDEACWRSQRRSGVNALYLQLRLLGSQVTYSEVAAQASRGVDSQSLAGLGTLADKLGYKAVPVRLTFEELRSMQTPTILVLESAGVDSGRLVVPCSVTDEQVEYIDAATVMTISARPDEFRRAWTGYALVLLQRTPVTPLLAGLLALGITALMVAHHISPSLMDRLSKWNGLGRVVAMALAVLAAVLLADNASGSDAALSIPKQLQQVLVEQSRRLDPINLSWGEVQQPVGAAEDVMKALQMSDARASIFFSSEQRLQLRDGRILKETERSSTSGTPQSKLIHSFDGSIFYIAVPEQVTAAGSKPARLTKVAAARYARENSLGPWFQSHYLEASGFTLPAKELASNGRVQSRVLSLAEAKDSRVIGCDLTPAGLQRVEIEAPDPAVQIARAADARAAERWMRQYQLSEQQIREHQADIQRRREWPLTKRQIFYLDPSRGYCLIRYEERSFGSDLVRLATANSKFRKIAGREIWLPEESVTSFYTWPSAGGIVFKEPKIQRQVRLISMTTAGAPPESFTLMYDKPGTRITDETMEAGSLQYEVPATVADLREVIQRQRHRSFIDKVRSYWLAVMAVGLCLMTGALWVWWRSRRVSASEK